MRPRLLILLVLSVVAPIVVLALVGQKIVRDEERLVREEVDGLLAARLDDVAENVEAFMAARQRLLDAATTVGNVDAAALRERAREAPFVSQLFVRAPDGSLLYPSAAGSLTENEMAFLRRTEQLWTKADSFTLPREGAGGRQAPGHGWYASYWQNGLNLIYWRREVDGRVIGAEVDRVRLLADLIAALPRSNDQGRTRLVDARGAVAHQWGRYEPRAGEVPRVERSLQAPLHAWRLQYYISPRAADASAGQSAAYGVLIAVTAVALALTAAAVFIYRESTRAIRDAMQRVTFVNQVSHELKTPLTNIRMYAELLEREVDETSPKAVRHLAIIVSESQRLSRLIGNVLAFARQRRDALTLHPAPGCVDQIIADVLAQHGPSLEQLGIAVNLDLDAKATVAVDRDALSQIIGNLVSNVEKYAASGRRVGVRTSHAGDIVTVRVRDHGPGIPAADADEVFRPFSRLQSSVTEGVSGAGIGLSLARDLARLHGGDLVLAPCDSGACLTLTLRAPQVAT